MSTRLPPRHMWWLVFFSATLSAGWPESAPGQSTADSTVVLSGGEYLDLRAGRLRPNGAIVVRGGAIVAMHPPEAGWRPPAAVLVHSLAGHTILPGLIDAHVHLTLAGPPAENAAATLRAGFTTVIDLGSADGAGIRLRDQIAGGQVLGPAVIAAGSWIGSKGGVCEFGGATVRSAEEAAGRARSDLSQGADLLKVCVTGWPAEAVSFPDSIQLKAGLLTQVADAAAAAGRPVYAHAIGRAGALLAAARGVRALAHTPIVDPADADRLRDAGVYVISTLATLTQGEGAARVRQSFRLLRRAGVPIVLGTDAGVLPHGSNARELVALTDNGLSPLEALRAATLDAAALLGSTRVGEIAVGRAGDFVVVDGDPLRDVRVLQRPVLVLRGGRAVPAAKTSP
jgi:imidazolonepropionase-like amidohydrolase